MNSVKYVIVTVAKNGITVIGEKRYDNKKIAEERASELKSTHSEYEFVVVPADYCIIL